MISTYNPEDIDVIILCGGLGTRLRGIINDRPKVMTEINSRPFLDILIDYISNYQFKHFILCVGYMSDAIKEYYGKKSCDLTILFSEEKEPLGTAGAIKNAEALIKSNPFLAMNGDSLCKINIQDFLSFHDSKKAMVSIALTTVEKPIDYGMVRMNKDQKIIAFNEKVFINSINLVNAGMYLFDRRIFEEIPVGRKLSLEYDLFPRILDKGVYGYVTDKELFDIGTPERLEMAKKCFKGERYGG